MHLTNKKTKLLNRTAMSTAVLLALYGGTFGMAQAQETQAGADANATTAASSENNISKVIVTARRRAELIQDVPGAVTALSAAELEKQAIPDITALTEKVPNTTLKASRGTNTTLTAYIRGIGQQDRWRATNRASASTSTTSTSPGRKAP